MRVRRGCQSVMLLTLIQFSPISPNFFLQFPVIQSSVSAVPWLMALSAGPLPQVLAALVGDLLSGSWSFLAPLVPRQPLQNLEVPLSLQRHLKKNSFIPNEASVVKISDFLTQGSSESVRGEYYGVDRPSDCCRILYTAVERDVVEVNRNGEIHGQPCPVKKKN